MSNKILLTGGGTAGHCTPNLALIPYLKQKGYEVVYVGTKDGIEREIITDAGIKYYPISAGKLRRYFSLKNFSDPFKILSGYFQAKKVINKEKPCLVFSKGGFVTVPVVFAAKSKHVPIVLHESDYTPGLANRLCIPKADKVCVSFEATSKHIDGDKCVITGAPVRKELLSGIRATGLELLGFDGAKKVLLIMGGSLGAQAVNDAVDASIDELLKLFDVAHIRGKGKLNPELEGKNGYVQMEYISAELPDVFACADLMLSRAGANAIFEILALNIPALLVPLPAASSRGDQVLNAAYFEKKGYSLVLNQDEVNEKTLIDGLKELLARADELKNNMHNSGMADGAKNVTQVIFSVLDSSMEG